MVIIFGVAIPIIIFLSFWILGIITRYFVIKYIGRWANESKTQIDDIFISSIKKPLVIWFLMAGLYFAVKYSWLPPDVVQMTGKILFVLGVVSVAFVLTNILSKSIKLYVSRIDSKLPVASLVQTITLVCVFGVAILIILNNLGISITPILASLGVGGLAVALALQDTLSNFFAGFHIIASKQVRLGDYIKLDSGEEGQVTDINWRTTEITAPPNHVVLVPNAKLTQAIINNYHLPTKEVAYVVEVGVHYKSDLDHVEQVACEVAKEVMRDVPGGVPEFNPVVRYHALGDFSVNLRVVMRAREYVDQSLLKHEFIKRLHKRFTQEGIVIPYPVQAVNVDQEKVTETV